MNSEENNINIVSYKEIKNLSNHPEILLIDVREPEELKTYGRIPNSINIPPNNPQKLKGVDVELLNDEIVKMISNPSEVPIMTLFSIIIHHYVAVTHCGFLCVEHALSNEMSAALFEERYGNAKPELNSPIIFSCRSGRRSLIACKKAKDLGYKIVKNYQGSWLDWAEQENIEPK